MALDDYLVSLRCRATPEIALRTRDSGRGQFSVPERSKNEVRDSEQRSDAQQGRHGASDDLSWALRALERCMFVLGECVGDQ